MGYLEEYKPVMAMTALQFCYAVMALSNRAALLQGMSPTVFVVYRQAIGTLFIAPILYFSARKETIKPSLGIRNLSLIFIAALIGVTVNQNIYAKGLYLASSSIASAMGNLVPAITFAMAAFIGLEVINIRSGRSIVKILGTVACVGGAVTMSLFKGPKLLNLEFQFQNSDLNLGGEKWIMGCLLLFGSSFCWAFWLILQDSILKSYPDHVSVSAWMCFFGTIQSGILAVYLEPDLESWNLHSSYELFSCFFSGIIGSGASFCVQAWCISQRGPLFSAMFSPLCTVIVTILAGLLLREELYVGSLVGAIAVVLGLYVVLWGKAKDLEINRKEPNLRDDHQPKVVKEFTGESTKESCKIDLEESLLG